MIDPCFDIVRDVPSLVAIKLKNRFDRFTRIRHGLLVGIATGHDLGQSRDPHREAPFRLRVKMDGKTSLAIHVAHLFEKACY